LYVNRITINGRLTEDPDFRKHPSLDGEEFCILHFKTEKPIRIGNENSQEDIYYRIIAFGRNASSIKGRVFQGTPLLVEAEIRNVDTDGSGARETIMQAVKIHFHERAPRRVDMSLKNKVEVKEDE